jgi:phage terminase large subunit-like protein
MDVWDNLLFGLRLGSTPRIVVTTTPRTTPLLRAIVKDSTTKISRASTFANKHLPESILKKFREKYEGTRLGRQELEAELLEDVVGALWTDDMVHHEPIEYVWQEDDIVRIVVAVDPSGSNGDSIGIVVAGLKVDGTYVVLADRTINGSPAEWGRAAVKAYEDFEADRLVAEVNFGGAMVEAVIRNVSPDVSYQEVRASRGKIIRAEPIAALYEQGKVTHVRGLVELEKQMMLMTNEGYVGEGSPDRVDALVWALTALSKKRSRKETSLAVEGERKAA